MILEMYDSRTSLLLHTLGLMFGRIKATAPGKSGGVVTTEQVLTTIEGAREFGVQLVQIRAANDAGLEKVFARMKQEGFLSTRAELFSFFVSKADLSVLEGDFDLGLCGLVGCNIPTSLPHVYFKRKGRIVSACHITLERVLYEADELVQKGKISYDQGIALVAKAYALGMIPAVSCLATMRGTKITEDEYRNLMISIFFGNQSVSGNDEDHGLNS